MPALLLLFVILSFVLLLVTLVSPLVFVVVFLTLQSFFLLLSLGTLKSRRRHGKTGFFSTVALIMHSGIFIIMLTVMIFITLPSEREGDTARIVQGLRKYVKTTWGIEISSNSASNNQKSSLPLPSDAKPKTPKSNTGESQQSTTTNTGITIEGGTPTKKTKTND